MFPKCLTIIILAIVAVKTLPADQISIRHEETNEFEEINYRLPNETVPSHYVLKLTPRITENNFDGRSNISLKVLKPTSDIFFHSLNLTYEASATKLISESGDVLLPESYHYNNISSILRIHFPVQIKPGRYNLLLKYTGSFSDDLYGFYKSSYENENGDTVWIASTQFQPISARKVFPCWDEPALKATFDISIKHHENYTVLSNMPVREKSETDAKDQKVWSHFETTPIMSTYLVAFVIANYTNISNADLSINVWADPAKISKAKFVHEIAQKASVELEKYTNSSVRVPKMDHVAVPKHSAAAMENWGLIIYRTYSIEYEDDSMIMKKMSIAATVVHELTHQWFGNLVSPTWWSHIWLNEGFAAYFENYIVDKIFDGWRMMDQFVVSTMHMSFLWDETDPRNPIDHYVSTTEEITSTFSTTSYAKAPSVLRMLSHIITEDVFRAGLIKYLDAHQYDSANPDCLWSAMQSALNESNVSEDDLNLKEIMDSWIKQTSYPLITVDRDYVTGRVTITQIDTGTLSNCSYDEKAAENEIKEEHNNTWWVPINYATKSNPDFTNTRPTHWLAPDRNLIIDGIDVNDWIIVNKQQMGYYRVNYDSTNWKKIADYLKTEDLTKVHELNRAQIVNDIIQLKLYDEVNATLLFEVVGYLSRETEYIPWYPVFQFLDDYKTYFVYPEAQRLKQFVLRTMENLIENVGFVERPEDDHLTKLKRIKVAEWACTLGHSECRKAAAATLIKYIRDPETQRIPTGMHVWVYCHGVAGANETIWNEVSEFVKRKYPNRSITRLLECTRNPVIFENSLNASLSNNNQLTNENRKELFVTIYRNPENLDTIIDFILRNWERIAPMVRNPTDLVEGLTKKVTRKEQIEKLKVLVNLSKAYESVVEEAFAKRLAEIEMINSELRIWTSAL